MATRKPTVTKTEELAAEATPVEKPEGSPGLYPFISLPRRSRSKFLRAFDTVSEKQDALDALADENGEVSLADSATLYDVLADIEDLLRVASTDGEVFDAWAAGASDADLMSLFAWYMERFQVGEA